MDEKTIEIIKSLSAADWYEILNDSPFDLPIEKLEELDKDIADSHDITKSDFGFKNKLL